MSGTMDHITTDRAPWAGEWGSLPPWVRYLDAKPLWIALTVLGFIAWWPIGLALLVFLLGSGRMGCGFGRRYGGAYGHHWRGWSRACADDSTPMQATASGNRAFDAYRDETLRRLEQEQREFAAFLDRLRFAKDKAEFDAFMAEQRQHPLQPDQPGTPG